MAADRERQPPFNTDDGDTPWSQYRRLVISELERLNITLEKIQLELAHVKVAVALLQLKASIWGATAGGVVVIGAILLKSLS